MFQYQTHYQKAIIVLLAILIGIMSPLLVGRTAYAQSQTTFLDRCDISNITTGSVFSEWRFHFYVEFTIPGSTVSPTERVYFPPNSDRAAAYTDNPDIGRASSPTDPIRVQGPGIPTAPGNIVPDDHWRVFIPGSAWLHVANLFYSTPGALVYLMCYYPSEPQPSSQQPNVHSVLLFPGFDSLDHPDCFSSTTYEVNWSGNNPIYLSGSGTSPTSFAIDDVAFLKVEPTGSQVGYVSETYPMGPFDVSNHFMPGLNHVEVRIHSSVPPRCGGSPLYLYWHDGLMPPDETYYPLINRLSIAAPVVGNQYEFGFDIPSWMGTTTVFFRKASDATISLRGPDGTIYASSHPNVEYLNTPHYSTLTLSDPPEGHWELLIDVTAAEPDSVFFFSVGGAQGDIPSTDNWAPFTTISLEAIEGLNDWLISDAQITLSAQDIGGSGVAHIEWSVDNGATWNLYSSPVTINQEGVTVFMARATDNAGNVEILPPANYLYIDKTPPVTTCDSTGPRDVNGIFRDMVNVTCNVSDVFSGKDYTEYSFDDGATWQRLEGTNDSFVIDGNGVTRFLYRSIDLAGNSEEIKDSGPIIINKYLIFSNSTDCSLRLLSNTTLKLTGDLHTNGCTTITYNTGAFITGTVSTVSGTNSPLCHND